MVVIRRMETADKQRYNQTTMVIEMLCFAPSKMGNVIETECLLFYAEIGILATRHSKTETDTCF